MRNMVFLYNFNENLLFFSEENELNHIKTDNMKICSDYKLIKRDNTEIMHSLHSLSIYSDKKQIQIIY